MDFKNFKNDKEIIQYLGGELNKINTLNECRLFREEQMQLTDEILHFRNCIEWLIRSNHVITNIKYALTKCLHFSEAMEWPLEETENKNLYSYYLEDAVYRDLVLWDMFRQLLNEYYKCGYSESDNVSIFKFLKDKKNKIGDATVSSITTYLNCDDHKSVRETLRNAFTHSIEATSSYVFHRNLNGKVQPQMDYLLPSHPFQNINYVVMDTLKLISFFNDIANEMYEYRNNNLILLDVMTIMPCGKEIDDGEHWNLRILKDKYEQIIVPCESPCEKVNKYDDKFVCKPTSVCYHRIYSKQEQTSGILTPSMTFAEIELLYKTSKK